MIEFVVESIMEKDFELFMKELEITNDQEHKKAIGKCIMKLYDLLAEKKRAPLFIHLASSGPISEQVCAADVDITMAVILLNPIKKDFPELSHNDLYQLAGVFARNIMLGDEIPFHLGLQENNDSRHKDYPSELTRIKLMWPILYEEHQTASDKCMRILRELIANEQVAACMLRYLMHVVGAFDQPPMAINPRVALGVKPQLGDIGVAIRLVVLMKETFPMLSYTDIYQLVRDVSLKLMWGWKIPLQPGNQVSNSSKKYGID